MLVRRAGGRFLHVEMDRALRAQLATDDAFRLRVFQVLTQSFR
jgi:hypothetical protein